jgi:hypothetical protein
MKIYDFLMAPPHTIMLALSSFLCTAIASSLFSIYLKPRKPPEGHNMLCILWVTEYLKATFVSMKNQRHDIGANSNKSKKIRVESMA